MASTGSGAAPPDTSAAEAFEKYLVPTIFGPWSRDLVDTAQAKPGDNILDIGCGTGASARYAVERVAPGGTVAAIDINAGMIAHAGTLCPPGDVDWREGDVMALPFEDGAFDTVIGNQVLQFLKDKPGALAEARRVLKPGGRLVLTVWCKIELCPGHCAVANSLQAHGVDAAGILHPYSYNDAVALGDVIQQAGFRDVAVTRRFREARFASARAFVEALAAGGPSSRLALEKLDADGLQQVIAEVTDALAEYTDETGVTIVTTSHVVVARRQ